MPRGSSSAARRRACSRLPLLVAALFLAAGCGAQGDADGGGDAASTGSAAAQRAASAGGRFPEGWRVRTDRGDTSPEAVDFVATERGFRVKPGPRAIYWNPEMTAEGAFRAHATFRRYNDPRAPEAYGLFVGGDRLRSPEQSYLYFLIRRGGEYLVKRRDGGETRTLVGWTSHDAVRTSAPGDTVPANRLAVESRREAVRFLINGTVVHRLSRAPVLDTEGQVGVRVNHRLDVGFADIGVQPLEGAASGGG